MYFLDIISEIVTSVQEVNVDILKCHEEVVEDRLNSLIKYLETLEGDILISSIIVCDETNFPSIEKIEAVAFLATFSNEKEIVFVAGFG
jgi:hypothetical protein